MSLRKHSTLRLIGLFTLASLLSPSLFAAVESAILKIGGTEKQVFGKKTCGSAEMVEIVLRPEALKSGNDFRAIDRPIKKADSTNIKVKPESACDPTLLDGAPNTQSFTKEFPQFPAKALMPESACGKSGVSESRVVCIYEGGGGKDLIAYAPYRIETAVAKIESISEPTATNGEVLFEVKIANGSKGPVKVETCYGKSSKVNIEDVKENCPDNFENDISSSLNVKITGLEDNVKYSFIVRIKEEKEDPSDWFEPAFDATPVPVADPFSTYEGIGGQWQFSCQQTNASSLWLFGFTFLALALLRRRSRTTVNINAGLLLFGMLFFIPESSHADTGQMNIGLLGAMYRPDLDSEVKASGEKIFPFYKCFFRRKVADKNGPINPLMGGEVDWNLWDGFGSLQLGLGFSYTFANGHAVKLDDEGQPNCDAPLYKAKSTLHMFQLRPQLTYLFDYFAPEFPLIPYVRGGLIGHGYMFRKGDKAAPTIKSEDLTIKPNGFRFGYQAAVGMMLMLDFLEPGSIRSARGQGYLEHVYLKGELSITKIDSFGRRGFQFSAKDVMGSTWPLMWTFGLVFRLP